MVVVGWMICLFVTRLILKTLDRRMGWKRWAVAISFGLLSMLLALSFFVDLGLLVPHKHNLSVNS